MTIVLETEEKKVKISGILDFELMADFLHKNSYLLRGYILLVEVEIPEKLCMYEQGDTVSIS